MKHHLIGGALLLAILFTTGCESFSRIAEFKEISLPAVNIVQYSDGPTLRISGQLVQSTRIVEKIRQIKDGRIIEIEVLTSPFSRDGHSGRFKTEVILDNIDFVVFGPEKTLIWRRYPDTMPYRERPNAEFKAPGES